MPSKKSSKYAVEVDPVKVVDPVVKVDPVVEVDPVTVDPLKLTRKTDLKVNKTGIRPVS